MPDIILGIDENRIFVPRQTNNRIKMDNAGSDVSKKCTHKGIVENAVKEDHAEKMPFM